MCVRVRVPTCASACVGEVISFTLKRSCSLATLFFFFKKQQQTVHQIQSWMCGRAAPLPYLPLPSQHSRVFQSHVWQTMVEFTLQCQGSHVILARLSFSSLTLQSLSSWLTWSWGQGSASHIHTPSLPPTSSPTTSCATSSERRDGGGGLREATACETRENFFQFGKYLFLYRKHLAHTGDEPSCSHKCCRDSL